MNDMKITTSETANTTFLYINCEDSTAVKEACVLTRKSDFAGMGHFVIVTWANGEEWGYRLSPTFPMFTLLGGESVGRFANAVKREAEYASKC